MKDAWKSLAAVCALVIGVYAYMARSGVLELLSPNAADSYYNLLVQGFRAGQLSVKKEVPPGLAQLANPYDPAANSLYRSLSYKMHDLSYYKGRLYLYFGVTPALILFWPFVALTGQYLFHRQAIAIFCSIGFLASVGLLCAVWRRYFAELNVWVVAACVLALGLATGVPVLLSQADVYEVPISCGYMLTMLALAAIWCALHQPERRCRWLAAASVAYGLAVGARPTLLFGAVILLVPVVQSWRERLVARTRHERRQIGALLIAAMGPILLIGLGLMLYNALRFDNPFEFGQHYQLAGQRQVGQPLFSLHYLWFNFRIYFLQPAHWSARPPFVHGTAAPALPAGYAQVRRPFGLLINIPVVWLVLAVPLTCRERSGQERGALRWFVAAVCLLLGICALTVGLFWSASFRYEVDFLPAALLLAVVGILGVERALAPTSESGQADRPVWRRAARGGYGLLLGFSVVFNLLASVEHYAEAHYRLGFTLQQAGKLPDAIRHYETALQIEPDYAEAHNNLGAVLVGLGRLQEAIGHYEQAVRIKPDNAEAHNNLGMVLRRMGKLDEAIGQYEQALRIKPDLAEAHNNLGVALGLLGKVQEAIGHFEVALRIRPDYPEAHRNLGVALEQTGMVREAVEHYEQALRLKSDYAEAHNNLANIFLREGEVSDAIEHYEQALRIRPDYADAHYNLGLALVRLGRLQEAIGHYEEALRIKPDDAEAHYNLGLALVRLGRVQEAIGHFEEALRIRPDYAEARNALAELPARQ